MMRSLLVFCFLLLAVSVEASVVKGVAPDKLPDIPKGITLTSPYSGGPSPLFNGRMTNVKILEQIVPDGWTTLCEKGILGKKTIVNVSPKLSWMAALEQWIAAPGYRILVRPETREVFVRKSPGGYRYDSVQTWRDTTGGMVYWSIQGGKPLKAQLDNWAKIAGYTLFWEAPLDYKMRGSATFDGSFEAAIQQLFDIMYHNGEMSLKATIYRGNKVIRVRQD